MPAVFKKIAPKGKIALVGMMGSGKTTLGRLLAARLGWEFVDVDTVIADRAGMAIPDIFSQRGEAEFRRREEEAVRAVVGQPGRHVVATGGGAFCQTGVREFLLARALTVFIKVEEEAIMRRLAAFDPAGRPMLSGDWRERARQLLRERYPLYAAARVTLAVGDEPPAATLERLLEAIGPEAIAPEVTGPEAIGPEAIEFDSAEAASAFPPPPSINSPHGASHA